jgi:hypothetical protein
VITATDPKQENNEDEEKALMSETHHQIYTDEKICHFGNGDTFAESSHGTTAVEILPSTCIIASGGDGSEQMMLAGIESKAELDRCCGSCVPAGVTSSIASGSDTVQGSDVFTVETLKAVSQETETVPVLDAEMICIATGTVADGDAASDNAASAPDRLAIMPAVAVDVGIVADEMPVIKTEECSAVMDVVVDENVDCPSPALQNIVLGGSKAKQVLVAGTMEAESDVGGLASDLTGIELKVKLQKVITW